jgi:hypothetical protein
MAVSTYLAALRRQTGVKLSPGGAPAPGPAASNGHAPRAAKPALSSAFTSATPADTSALVSNEAACKSDEPLPPRPLAGIAARVRRELAILGHDPLPEFVPFPDRLSVAKALEMTVADVSAALVELRGEEPGEDAPGRAAAERVPAPEGPQDAPGADSDAFAAPERSTAPEPEPEDVARLRAENEQLRRELQWVTSERESAQELADERGDLRRLLAATEERLAKESACRAELELELEATREVMVAAAGMTETPTLRELREELTRDQRRLALQFAHELVNNPLRACLEGSNHAVEARLAMARLAIRIVEEALG